MFVEVFGPRGTQNGAKNEVFEIVWKINGWNFSDFLHEITPWWRLKIDSEENLMLGFFGQKKGLTWVFLLVQQIEALIFCMKLLWCLGWNLGKIIVTRFLFWDFCYKKAWKWARNEVFQVLWRMKYDMYLFFWMKLQQHEGLKLQSTFFLEKNLVVSFFLLSLP